MSTSAHPFSPRKAPPAGRSARALATAVVWACACACWSVAHAERADRSKPMEIESDGQQAASVDLKNKLTTINGNVVITQGTLRIRADKVEVREPTPGRFHATALGGNGEPAVFRQKRDRVNEYVEAEAQRVEYDGATERVRFIGQAKLRVMRPNGPPDEASAAVISYDQRSDTIVFEGSAPGSSSATGTTPPGRAKLVFIPRTSDAAASEPWL